MAKLPSFFAAGWDPNWFAFDKNQQNELFAKVAFSKSSITRKFTYFMKMPDLMSQRTDSLQIAILVGSFHLHSWVVPHPHLSNCQSLNITALSRLPLMPQTGSQNTYIMPTFFSNPTLNPIFSLKPLAKSNWIEMCNWTECLFFLIIFASISHFFPPTHPFPQCWILNCCKFFEASTCLHSISL